MIEYQPKLIPPAPKEYLDAIYAELKRQAPWLEDRVPAKHVFAARGYDIALTSSHKEHWLSVCRLTVSVDALGVGGLIIKSG